DVVLKQARETVAAGFAHQDVAFEQIVETAGVSLSAERHPLFQACLVMQNMPMPELTLPHLRAMRVPDAHPVSPFDLVLTFDLISRPAEARLLYRPDRCDGHTARRIAALVEGCLRNAPRGPGGPAPGG